MENMTTNHQNKKQLQFGNAGIVSTHPSGTYCFKNLSLDRNASPIHTHPAPLVPPADRERYKVWCLAAQGQSHPSNMKHLLKWFRMNVNPTKPLSHGFCGVFKIGWNYTLYIKTSINDPVQEIQPEPFPKPLRKSEEPRTDTRHPAFLGIPVS